MLSPRSRSTDLSEWYVSTPQRRASLNDDAPTGMTMNSCRSMLLSACAPPFKTLSIGTGSTCASRPPIDAYSGVRVVRAWAWASARLAPSRAFAPRRPLFAVPSSEIIAWSAPAWSPESRPTSSERISPFTLATALVTPLPRYRLPPSRSSTASCSPVDAPEGTIALPCDPSSSRISTSTVGLPRESSTSRPMTSEIFMRCSG